MGLPQSSKPSYQTGQEIHVNAGTITHFAVALALMTSLVSAYAAAESSPRYPYTGPDVPVMTTG